MRLVFWKEIIDIRVLVSPAARTVWVQMHVECQAECIYDRTLDGHAACITWW